MFNVLKKIFMTIVYIATGLILIVALVLITEFSPTNGEELKVIGKGNKTLKKGDTLSILTYNIGHLISQSESTCFLEGGTMVGAKSKDLVEDNLEAIKQIISKENADIVTLQEVDYKSSISYKINEYIEIANAYEGVSSIALFQNTYVPYPLKDMVGKVKTGIATYSKYDFRSCRINLTENYEFPQRLVMPKKSIQKQIIPLENSDAKLIVLNIELEDYDNGTEREKQLYILKAEMEKEYAQGNYVIVSGDFNMTFPEIINEDNISSGEYIVTSIPSEFLSEGWKYGVDKSIYTFRLRDKAYDKETSFMKIVDGFIVSPNITIKNVKTIDTDFKYSNHNPVKMEIVLNK